MRVLISGGRVIDPSIGADATMDVAVAAGRVVAQGSPAELCLRTGKTSLEDAFISLIGTDEGIAA